MADWLHCNTCFHQPGDGVKFVLTSCGHIYCEQCVLTSCTEKCNMCGSSCNTIKLSGSMKPEVEIFFSNPLDLSKTSSSQLKKHIQVIDFQQNHRRRFISYLKDKLHKQQKLIAKANLAVQQYSDLEKEMMKTMEENSYLKRLLNEKGGHGRVKTSPNTSLYRNSPTTSPGHSMQSMSSSLPPRSSQVDRSLSQGHYSAYSRMSVSPGSSLVSPMSQQRSKIGSYSNHPQMNMLSSTIGRVSVRTPPVEGRIGTVGTPSPSVSNRHKIINKTPKSVPHPIVLGTPSPR